MGMKFQGSDQNRKTNRRTMLFSNKQYEMANEIAERTPHTTFQDIIDTGLLNYYRKVVPPYATMKMPMGAIPVNQSIEAAAKSKVAMKQAMKEEEQNKKEQAKALICTRDLFGKVQVNDSGVKTCVFQVHTKVKSSESRVPLMQCDPVIARSIFQPNKKAVLEARPELAAKYN